MSIAKRQYRSGDPSDLSARLRQRITIEQPVEVDDGLGGTDITWGGVVTVWAEVIPLNSGRNETSFAYQQEARLRHRITIRYRDGIDASMRINFEGRYFNIRSVTDVAEGKTILEIIAEEGVAI